jgi:hypothetical protein
MYILVIRNHQDSVWLRFVYTRDFILDRRISESLQNEIEIDKDAFETITILFAAVVGGVIVLLLLLLLLMSSF